MGAKKSPSTSCVSRLLDTGEKRTNPSVGTNSPFSGELHWENMPRHPTIEDVDRIFQIEVGDIHKNGSPVQIEDFALFWVQHFLSLRREEILQMLEWWKRMQRL